MKTKNPFVRGGIIGGVFLFFVLFNPNNTLAYDFSGWSHGASGYSGAIEDAMNADKPLILYFHTEWCKWAKKMNNDYISSPEVEGYLSNIHKVEIDPDKGAPEKSLTERYNVTGYPSFLIAVPSLYGEVERIWPFCKGTHWTTDEFLRAVKEGITQKYNSKSFSCYKSKNFKDALRYLDMALGFDSENGYSYYLRGRIQYTIGHKDKNSALLKEAEDNYLKALEIDPDDQGTIKDLEQLHKLMKYVGLK